jgi:hypothetical protein
MKKLGFLTIIALLSSCQESLLRTDRISPYAGDSLARNYSNQMVDPWPPYVYDTDIETSSERQAAVRMLYRTKYNGKDSAGPAGVPLVLSPQPAAGPTPLNAQNTSQ